MKATSARERAQTALHEIQAFHDGEELLTECSACVDCLYNAFRSAEAAARAEGFAAGVERAAEVCERISEGDGCAFAERVRALTEKEASDAD